MNPPVVTWSEVNVVLVLVGLVLTAVSGGIGWLFRLYWKSTGEISAERLARDAAIEDLRKEQSRKIGELYAKHEELRVHVAEDARDYVTFTALDRTLKPVETALSTLAGRVESGFRDMTNLVRGALAARGVDDE